MGTAGDSQQVTTDSVYSTDAENQTNTQRDDLKHVRSWKSYVWDTWDLPPDQRWMLFKVDAYVLTFASLGYFLKNIDQTNVNNAFLSGMKEDLGMYGDQLVTSTCIRSRPTRFVLSSLT
jgi:ACS family pantothenate transporter-like MFS transporter